MLTNFQLEDLAKKYHIPLVAICMKDELPKSPRDGNYIINLQSSDGGKNTGTHWTALIIKGKYALFSDPFGEWPSMEIRDFVKKRKGCHLGFIDADIQDIDSDNCGRFCLSFLKYVNSNDLYDSANKYVHLFSKNTKLNDKILMQMF